MSLCGQYIKLEMTLFSLVLLERLRNWLIRFNSNLRSGYVLNTLHTTVLFLSGRWSTFFVCGSGVQLLGLRWIWCVL